MRKILFIFCFFLTTFSFSKSLYLSNFPLPSAYIIDLDNTACYENCLENYLNKGQVFSFLSHYLPIVTNKKLKNQYKLLQSILNIKNTTNKEIFSIALLVPKKIIGRYAISTANSIIAYLLSRNINFQLEVFNCKNEDLSFIQKSIEEIKNKNYKFVIAPFTSKGLKNLSKIHTSLIFYIPTLNKKEFPNIKSNFIFGGINYKKQINTLLSFANNRLAIFSDESSIGFQLNKDIENSRKNIVYKKIIPYDTTRFKYFLKRNSRLNNSSIFLNTPLVTSSLLASQFRFYKIKPYALFSTQINYNPILLSLTQYEDRKNFYIANSIGKANNHLVLINKLLGNNITFDWINYSTSIGIDYFYTLFFNNNANRFFDENISANQVQYAIKIFKPTKSSFQQIINFNQP